jgi:hypothetical protein
LRRSIELLAQELAVTSENSIASVGLGAEGVGGETAVSSPEEDEEGVGVVTDALDGTGDDSGALGVGLGVTNCSDVSFG